MMRFFALSLLVLALPLFAEAHAFGVSHETVVDGIHLDIGYSSAAPVAGESVIFDFNLPVGEEDEEYTDVWVRVDGEDGSTKLATAIYNASFGGPRMSYAFGEPGTYTISVRYENDGTALVKTEWPITVLPPAQEGFPAMLRYLLIALAVVAAGAGYVALKHRRLKA